jgi:hypothetical protein
MARERLDEGNGLTNLTPEQIKLMAMQEAQLAAMQTQANNRAGFSEKENRKGDFYETNARIAANTERIKAASAQVGNVDSTSLNQDIADSQAAINNVNSAMAEVQGLPPKSSGTSKFVATDGKEFTDENAYATYQASLTADARDKYDKEQAAAAKAAQDKAEKQDAFATIRDTMRSYGFTDAEMGQLSAYIEGAIVNPDIGPQSAILGMRNLDVYKQRFAGNTARVAAGKNALSEYDYLQQENAYSEYMKSYGVDNLATRDQFKTLIGNDVSATELNKRLGLAVDRVKNSDPEIMTQLKSYYPNVTDKDLITYFLNPKDALPELERKVTVSEISAAAVNQGFAADKTGAEGLAAYGVTRDKALTGYQDIKTVLPTSEKLSSIYGEANIKYDKAMGEAEFLKNNADAAENRRRLKSMERAAFQGDSGLSTQFSSLGKSIQGKF